MKIKASYQADIEDFPIPRHVPTPPPVPYVFDPVAPPQVPPPRMEHVPIEHLSAEVLETLCDNFRTGVFKAAGKQHPPQAAEKATPKPLNDEQILQQLIEHGLSSAESCFSRTVRDETLFKLVHSLEVIYGVR